MFWPYLYNFIQYFARQSASFLRFMSKNLEFLEFSDVALRKLAECQLKYRSKLEDLKTLNDMDHGSLQILS